MIGSAAHTEPDPLAVVSSCRVCSVTGPAGNAPICCWHHDLLNVEPSTMEEKSVLQYQFN